MNGRRGDAAMDSMSERERQNILGCYISGPTLYHDADPVTREIVTKKNELFRSYIWGEFGLSEPLKDLTYSDYGQDLRLALLEFYVLPLLEQLAVLKEIGRFRRKEKSIGLPIIIHDYNFFDKSDLERRQFLKTVILEKLELLAGVIKRNKLDTDLTRLKADTEGILSSIVS